MNIRDQGNRVDEGGQNERPASDVHRTHSRGNSVAIHYFALWPHAGTGRCDRDGARLVEGCWIRENCASPITILQFTWPVFRCVLQEPERRPTGSETRNEDMRQSETETKRDGSEWGRRKEVFQRDIRDRNAEWHSGLVIGSLEGWTCTPFSRRNGNWLHAIISAGNSAGENGGKARREQSSYPLSAEALVSNPTFHQFPKPGPSLRFSVFGFHFPGRGQDQTRSTAHWLGF